MIFASGTSARTVRMTSRPSGSGMKRSTSSRSAPCSRYTRSADLLLVDLFIPEPDGLEVIRTVRAEVPDAKIIAMSGGGSLKLDLLAAAAAFGASRALWKPFVPDVLLAAVRDLLGERGV